MRKLLIIYAIILAGYFAAQYLPVPGPFAYGLLAILGGGFLAVQYLVSKMKKEEAESAGWSYKNAVLKGREFFGTKEHAEIYWWYRPDNYVKPFCKSKIPHKH